MAIGMQGVWTVSVKSKNAAYAQRFRIEGSANGVDGVYSGLTSTAPILVSGDQWGVTIEHNPTGPVSWTASSQRFANHRTASGLFHVDIESNDSGGDADYNDLVLTCSMPLSDSDWVLYGAVKSYSGHCGVNPCFPGPYVAIDTMFQLESLLKYESVREIIEKIYPDRVKVITKRPFPIPDPPPFKPMLIPTGLSDTQGLRVRGQTQLEMPRPKRTKSAASTGGEILVTESAKLYRHETKSSTRALAAEDLLALGRIKDLVLKPCRVDPLADTLLRFLEYDRTAAELAGGAYVGDGNRETLGLTATDEFGNYVFRFSRTLAEILTEAGDLSAGEDPLDAAFPDIIIQVVETLPEGVAYETASFFDVPNVRRINLCIPESEIEGVEQPCQDGRAIQYLGNITILPNPHSELYADGTITNLSSAATGPAVRHAAWYGGVHVYGCFHGTTPEVVRYTWEYRPDGDTTWHLVNQPYEYLQQQPDATWDNALVGPFDHSLRVNGAGDPKVTVPAYDNIEKDASWAISHRHRKIILSTALYQANVGAVRFRIQGYDASGEKVSGASDEFRLYIDNVASTGDVEFVKLVGETDPGECALLELQAVGTPLEVKYRVRDPEGFLDSYDLKVWRGSNTEVAITGSPVSGDYQDVSPYRYSGTPDESGADLDGYVDVVVTPAGNDWLGGHTFCAFSFELTSRDRRTNGLSVPGVRTLWRELVGISLAPPSASGP